MDPLRQIDSGADGQHSWGIGALLSLALLSVQLTACAYSGRPQSNVVQRFTACKDEAQHFPFDRAFVADNGESVALRCGDGSLRAWDATQSSVDKPDGRSLIDLARDRGVVPSFVQCVSTAYTRGDDCDLVDFTADKSSSIIRDMGGTYWILENMKAPREIQGIYTGGGVLLPRSGPPDRVVTTKRLDSRTIETRLLKDQSLVSSFRLPNKSTPFKDTEGEAHSVVYSRAYDLLIIGCGGAFIYFEGDIALLRAYSVDGKERWSMRRPLPLPEKDGGLHAGFTSLYARVFLADDGRYAVVSHDKTRSKFEVIDLADGHSVITLPGWPIAASAKTKRLLVRVSEDEIQLVDLASVLPD
jgi:hypothetical protein